MTLRIEYEDIAALQRLPRNPKLHNLGAISASQTRWGLLEQIIVNDATGHLLEGHGRLASLQALRASGAPAPAGVRVTDDGRWLAPVVRGVSVPAGREEAAAIALNRIQDLGGYDEAALGAVLADLLASDNLAATGYNAADVEFLARTVGGLAERFTGVEAGTAAPDGAAPPVEQALSDARGAASRIVILFSTAAERAAFWRHLGTADRPTDVTVKWAAVEAQLPELP